MTYEVSQMPSSNNPNFHMLQKKNFRHSQFHGCFPRDLIDASHAFVQSQQLRSVSCAGTDGWGFESPGKMSSYPIASMYGIFIYIWLISMLNVGKYTIHECYGYVMVMESDCANFMLILSVHH